MTILLRPDKIGYTHRTGRRPVYSESKYWDHYAETTKFYDGPAKRGATYRGTLKRSPHGAGAARDTDRSFRSTGRSIAGVGAGAGSGGGIGALRASTRNRHARRMMALQQKLEAAKTERLSAEARVSELDKKIDKICDHFGRIQVSNPGQNLDEMEPMHRWELFLERTSNNLVALEDERRRQQARREKQKQQWNMEDMGR